MFMLCFLFSFILSVRAAEGQSAQVLPGALPIAESSGSQGVLTGQYLPEAVHGFEVSYGLKDDLSVHGALAAWTIFNRWTGRTLMTAALRRTLLQRENLSVAPYLVAFMNISEIELLLAPGIAIEGGGDRIRLDVSAAPLVMRIAPPLHYGDPRFQFGALPTVEGGATVRITDRHALRVGGFMPTLGYRFTSDKVYAEASHTRIPWSGDTIWSAKAGRRF